MLHFGRIHGCFSYQRAGRESETALLFGTARTSTCRILWQHGNIAFRRSWVQSSSSQHSLRQPFQWLSSQTANGYSDCWNRIVVWSVARSVIATELGAEPRFSPAPSDSPSAFFLLCLSSCSPFRELGLDQVPDYTAVAFCESEFVCQAGFQKHADSVMACQVSCGN